MNTVFGVEARRWFLALLFGGMVMQVVAFFLFAAGMKPQLAWALAAAPATITAVTVARRYEPAEITGISLPMWRIVLPLALVVVVGFIVLGVVL